jgi:hypothetical protein
MGRENDNEEQEKVLRMRAFMHPQRLNTPERNMQETCDELIADAQKENGNDESYIPRLNLANRINDVVPNNEKYKNTLIEAVLDPDLGYSSDGDACYHGLKGLVEAWQIDRENSDSVMESGVWKAKFLEMDTIIEKYFRKS